MAESDYESVVKVDRIFHVQTLQRTADQNEYWWTRTKYGGESGLPYAQQELTSWRRSGERARILLETTVRFTEEVF